MKEIERKFIVAEGKQVPIPRAAATIVQEYICMESGRETRIRHTAGFVSEDYRLTVKTPISDGVRSEEEHLISKEVFNSLSSGRRVVKKTRFLVEDLGKNFSVDFYTDHNSGLVVAEIEFRSEKDMEEFDPRRHAFLGREVTGSAEYSNYELAGEMFVEQRLEVKEDKDG